MPLSRRAITSSFICLTIAHTLVACVAVGPAKPFVDNFEPASKYSFELVDKRQPGDTAGSMGSNNRWSCEFGIWRIADAGSLPSKIEYLKTRLQNEVSKEILDGKIIVLSEYSTHLNYQLAGRTALSGVPRPSLIGEALKTMECWQSEEAAGGYDLKLNKTAQTVGVVLIKLEINSKQYVSKYAFVPGESEQNMPVLGTAIIRAVDQLVQKINASSLTAG